MKSFDLAKRIQDLSLKLNPLPSEGVRIDFYSLSQSEQFVVLKTYGLLEKYKGRSTDKVAPEDEALFLKFDEIALRISVELFLSLMRNALMLDEFEEFFFKGNFNDFLGRWSACRSNLKRWSKEEREKILHQVKVNHKKAVEGRF